MAKEIKFAEDARANNATRSRCISRYSESDISPKGRNVVLEKSFGSPLITNDGVTIAKEIELEDHFENMGAKLVSKLLLKRMILPVTEQQQRLF